MAQIIAHMENSGTTPTDVRLDRCTSQVLLVYTYLVAPQWTVLPLTNEP